MRGSLSSMAALAPLSTPHSQVLASAERLHPVLSSLKTKRDDVGPLRWNSGTSLSHWCFSSDELSRYMLVCLSAKLAFCCAEYLDTLPLVGGILNYGTLSEEELLMLQGGPLVRNLHTHMTSYTRICDV